MLWPKKNSYKEFDKEKFRRLENSPPLHPISHNFSNLITTMLTVIGFKSVPKRLIKTEEQR